MTLEEAIDWYRSKNLSLEEMQNILNNGTITENEKEALRYLIKEKTDGAQIEPETTLDDSIQVEVKTPFWHRFVLKDTSGRCLIMVIAATCLMLWQTYITIPIGIALLAYSIIDTIALGTMYGNKDDVERLIDIDVSKINELEARISDLKKDVQDLKEQKKQEAENIELHELLDSMDFSCYDGFSSEDCKNELSIVKQGEKNMIKNGRALEIDDEYGVSKKEMNNRAKQILRCFNAECDNIILAANSKNIDSLRMKITKSYDSLNNIFVQSGVSITEDFLRQKLEELTLVYSYERERQNEKELQKEIKAQMVEEEKVRRELEKKRKQIEKDEKQFKAELDRMFKYLQKTDLDVEKQLYVDKIKELEEKIKALEEEKKDVITREENAKAGFVYIISNIGSFGEDIYKIGMTRRLEPMDRIKELSSASVPFEFDVHAMIFSDNAPELESKLHQHFDSCRVNKVNPRKEFFKVSIDEIEEYVVENFSKTVEFTKIPVAKDYRDSLYLLDNPGVRI